MSTDGQGTKWHRNIAENFSRLSRAHEHYRQMMEGWASAYSELTFAKNERMRKERREDVNGTGNRIRVLTPSDNSLT